MPLKTPSSCGESPVYFGVMLNYRLLNIVLNSQFIRVYLGILGGLGFAVLLDVVLFIQLSYLVGPWLVMALLALTAGGNLLVAFKIADFYGGRLMDSVNGGVYSEEYFVNYAAALFAGIFLVPPGLVNTLIGYVILLPPVSRFAGSRMAKYLGVNWSKAYEYLRLNTIMDTEAVLNKGDFTRIP
ncbi:MAG: hypothetical protein B0D92_07500 [Spirochaeta sp. LUC14_002_19_P3]|nr:MAG: hypothetical protein B0D92_07500 [Spirochaeta sp. LUC14_002_19_P3]